MVAISRRWLWLGSIAGALSFAPRAGLADEPRPYHPEPRVIVNVTSVRGPHPRKEVERAARLAWGRIVGCYEAKAGKAKGVVQFELGVASTGKLTWVRRIRSTFKNPKLEECLSKALKATPMPPARAGSTAHAEIHLAPGDARPPDPE